MKMHLSLFQYLICMERLSKPLVNNKKNSGFQFIHWNATNNQGKSVSAGVYFYRIEIGDFRQTKKMILFK